MASLKTDGKAFIAIFIGAMIAIAFLITISDDIFEQTNIRSFVNETVTAAAINASVDLTGRTFLTVTEAFVNNATATSCLNLGCNLQTGTGTDGLQAVQLVLNDTAEATMVGKEINVSYTAEPNGYLPTSGARTIQNTVLIFGALAIFITVIVILFSGSLKELIKGFN